MLPLLFPTRLSWRNSGRGVLFISRIGQAIYLWTIAWEGQKDERILASIAVDGNNNARKSSMAMAARENRMSIWLHGWWREDRISRTSYSKKTSKYAIYFERKTRRSILLLCYEATAGDFNVIAYVWGLRFDSMVKDLCSQKVLDQDRSVS